MISIFARCGSSPTRFQIEEWVVNALRLRLLKNKARARECIKLNQSAHNLLAPGSKGLSENWFQGFYSRHPEVVCGDVSGRSLSPQRVMAATHSNYTILCDRRMDALRSTGILNPETNEADISRIYSIDECPNQLDGAGKGNNREQHHSEL